MRFKAKINLNSDAFYIRAFQVVAIQIELLLNVHHSSIGVFFTEAHQ